MSSSEIAENTPEVFLDTSIFVARHKGPDMRRKIAAALVPFAWRGTGTYAKLEYGNVILTAACYLYRKLNELGSLERLRYFMANQLPHNEHYKLWFSNLLSTQCGNQDATERAQRCLRHLVRVGTSLLEEQCDGVHDCIQCDWVDQRLTTGNSAVIRNWQNPSRRSIRPHCRIDGFFSENAPVFESIQEAIGLAKPAEMTEELRDFARIIDAATKEPGIIKNCATCAKLGDAILAVQSKSNGYNSFITQNIRESQVLCRVLSQLLLYVGPSLEKAVERFDFRLTQGGNKAPPFVAELPGDYVPKHPEAPPVKTA